MKKIRKKNLKLLILCESRVLVCGVYTSCFLLNSGALIHNTFSNVLHWTQKIGARWGSHSRRRSRTYCLCDMIEQARTASLYPGLS